jgi:hypothetical protein
MKVKIGPYHSWFGPYQLAEALCFWVKDVPDEHGFPRKPDWVHNFGEWLAYGSIEPEQEVGEVRSWDRDRKPTIIHKFLSWVESKKKRKIKVHIDKWDTWSMDTTLAHIILPMLKQLKETKHGSPFVDDEDVPEELRSISAPPKENEWDTDEHHHARWDWTIDEMIFAFEKKLDEDWEKEFRNGEYDLKWVKLENGMFQMVRGENDTAKFDEEGYNKVKSRITNGFRLFGKYYENLWD